jgi:predicted nuclease of predicted toxin-antitoxin system
MKYLIDAQLPFRLSVILKEHGYDVIHTDDMPRKALSSDGEIRQRSFRDDRAVITKDADFLDSYYSSGAPKKL